MIKEGFDPLFYYKYYSHRKGIAHLRIINDYERTHY